MPFVVRLIASAPTAEVTPRCEQQGCLSHGKALRIENVQNGSRLLCPFSAARFSVILTCYGKYTTIKVFLTSFPPMSLATTSIELAPLLKLNLYENVPSLLTWVSVPFTLTMAVRKVLPATLISLVFTTLPAMGVWISRNSEAGVGVGQRTGVRIGVAVGSGVHVKGRVGVKVSCLVGSRVGVGNIRLQHSSTLSWV